MSLAFNLSTRAKVPTTSDECQPDESADQALAALDVRDLSAGYNGDLALEGIAFAVQRGERIALVGPNGAGKSTLLKTLIGLLKPARGEIRIHGDASRQAISAHVAYVPQFGEIDWDFPVSVWDVVMMGRTRHIGWFRLPLPGGRHALAVQQALDRVGLLPYANRPINELSGGQKRRVFVARALAQQADILLLDEPFAGVDARAQDALMKVLDSLQCDGVTVILATHDLSLASSQFDRVLLLNRTMVAYGRPAEVFSAELLAQTYGGQLAILGSEGRVIVVADQHE